MDQKFEIYKQAVEMADRVSARRLTANGFFVTVNTAVAGLLAFAFVNVAKQQGYILWVIALVGVLLSATWFFSIRAYKRLNRAKFDVIHQLEGELEFDYFKREWEALKRVVPANEEPKSTRSRWLEWKDRYTDLTSIEGVVPIVYALVYVLLAVLAIVGLGLI